MPIFLRLYLRLHVPLVRQELVVLYEVIVQQTPGLAPVIQLILQECMVGNSRSRRWRRVEDRRRAEERKGEK